MPTLLVVGGGLFGSQAAAYARHKGIETIVFDAALPDAASPAAAGLFTQRWAGKKLHEHYHCALPVLEKLYGTRTVTLTNEDGRDEAFLWVPPSVILDANPVREKVTAVGDGWLEAGGRRYEGWVYVAAGVWCPELRPEIEVYAKSGAAFIFPGESAGRIRPFDHGRHAISFVRDKGTTYFNDGAAEIMYTEVHAQATLCRAADFGLTTPPVGRLFGHRPYTPGGPLFRKLSPRTWLATGGRKMGTIIGASFAHRLVEVELR